MATKTDSVSFKDKQNTFIDSNDYYSNLNLNQNSYFMINESIHSKSDKNDHKTLRNYGFETINITQGKEDSTSSCSKPKKHFTKSCSLNGDSNFDKKDEFKRAKNSNNSTLSLHISAYENLNEVTVDSECSKKKESNLFQKWENAKQFFTGSSSLFHNPFEFPRQQGNKENIAPEISQFKASQKLLNPNKQLPSFNTAKNKMAKKKRSVQAEPAAASDDNTDEIFDEVDIYHQKRDKEILGDFNTEKKKHRVESEVLGVVASESDSSDNEDYDSDESEDSVDERLGKKKVNGDISRNKSADAWGSKKLAYYGSHADKDYGGLDEDEAEALDLEEEDAITRQKKLDAGIEAVDFAGLLASDDEGQENSVITLKKTKTEEKVAKNKFDTMNKKKQVEYMLKHSESFDQFVKEYNKRKAQFEELKPMLDSILLYMNDYNKCPFTKQIKAITAAYTQYLQSYLMFFYLKETTPVENFKLIENHPVLDDIIKQYPMVKQIDEFIENNYRRLMKVADRLKDDPSYAEAIANPKPPKKKRRTAEDEMDSELIEEDIESVFARMASGKDKNIKKVNAFGPALNEIEGVGDEDKKRKITYEMQKNKGLTVKRKKGTAHSRVKKRSQFKKAIHKHRSQVPEVQREVTKYDGERRGIRASTVRSIKLKA